MYKKGKGEVKMNTLTLRNLESRVIQNSNRYKTTVNRVTTQIQSQNLNQGRIRPKDPTEAKILARFTQK